jgi:hypothetical protein
VDVPGEWDRPLRGWRFLRGDAHAEQCNFAPTNAARKCAAQVLHLVVLHGAIGIAAVMMALSGAMAGAAMIAREHQFGLGHVCGVLADQRHDTQDLGAKE